MLAAERTASEASRSSHEALPEPGAARRLGAAALGLLLVPLAIEAAALDPRVLVGYREPLFAALRLALANGLPYFAVAASAGALALVLGGRAVPVGRPSVALLVAALGLAGVAAATTPTFHAALLAGDVRMDGACARVGGPLSSCVDLAPVPLEEAGDLARVTLPARAPWDATVRWVGVRTAEDVAPGARVELVGGGAAIDVTDALRALPPGGAAVFEHALRLGPGAGTVRLRLSDDPLPPAVFFDARRAVDVVGMAVEAGGGDRAWRAEPATGPAALPVPTLRIAGEHVEGGHALVVLSGEAWGVHDLQALARAEGQLELALAGAPTWRVRFVGDGAESQSFALSELARTDEEGIARYALPLDRVDFGALSPRSVVGVAIAWDGPPGPFALDVAGARVALPERRSGYALGTLAVLDPGVPATEAMLAVGEPPAGGVERHGGALRLFAALLGLLGAVGLPTLPRALRALPVRAPVALAAGPLLAMGLEPVVRAFAAPRLEHLPLALGAAAVGASVAGVAARREVRARAARVATDPRLASVEALLGVAGFGVVAAHVGADAAGQPWTDHPVEARRAALVVHALAGGFEAPLFVLAALFGLAHLRHGAGAGVGEAVSALARRLVPAFVFWSLAYLLLRHGKAVAFGYELAYRRELAQGATWLRAALLGGAQYHLYVFPLVLVLALLVPLYAAAVRRPLLALGALATLALWPALDARVYAEIAAPEARTWALWGTRAVGFAGYGLLAFALYGLAGRARRLLLSAATVVALGSAAVLVQGAWRAAETGAWPAFTGPAWLAPWLLPAAVFTLFVAADLDWPAWLRRLGLLAPGVYLVHPAVLDAFEIAERGAALSPTATVALNFAGVSAVSLLLVAALARVRALRFTVGLR